MAFHVSCPITCRRVCFCELGFPAGLQGRGARSEFWAEIEELEEFLRDPWTLRSGDGGGGHGATVQVEVPRVEPPEDDGEEARRAAMQRQAMAAEDFVRRLEARSSVAAEVEGEAATNYAVEDQGFSVKIMCRLCFSGEDEGSDRAARMLPCKSCNKKYHRSCLKTWAEYRDLFHWSSWACPSCRICEVCRKTGDPNKLKYCKRCDGAYHCYCQQPVHKNVSHGPYLCPKHTRCHSCGSIVPGSGHSTRWFLGYTCCDACGRLFVKGNYCPVCLKVYRDSESIPMVCCDVCEKWVHCECDGISEEKYMQFQADQNLPYTCPACRGECYQIKDTEDAIRELWKRRDTADHDQIASFRASAGLPLKEETFSLCPCSDDEVGPIILKNDNRKTLKFSLKGITDKSSVSSLEHETNNFRNSVQLTKKHFKKKSSQTKLAGDEEEIYLQRRNETPNSLRDQKIDDMNFYGNDRFEMLSSSQTRSPEKGLNSGKNAGIMKEIPMGNSDLVRKVKIKGAKQPSLHLKESAGENLSKNDSGRTTKLVIHIGSRNRNVSGSPRTEASSCQRDQEMGTLHGLKVDCTTQKSSLHDATQTNNVKALERVSDGQQTDISVSKVATTYKSHATGKRSNSKNPVPKPINETASGNKILGTKQSVDASDIGVNSLNNDPKPLLKLKFKNPYFENRTSWVPEREEESSAKGQRSKRKRPSAERVGALEEGNFAKLQRENMTDGVMDANWILQKLGKDAIGKRVEVRLSEKSSWHQGMVSDVVLGTSSVSVRLDDGRSENLELGKHGIRFISQSKKGRNTKLIC